MKIGVLTLLIGVLIAFSAKAEASRHYYLVGIRHIYKFEMFPDPREPERQQIEEDYAASVKQAQDQYDQDMGSIADEEAKDDGRIHQDDRDAVQENIEKGTADAADQREFRLGQIYVQCDWVRTEHPELTVDQDGPYQVMGVETRRSGEFYRVAFYRPYPLYIDICPFGWTWGRSYTFVSFGIVVQTWHRTWISLGCPVFAPLYHEGHRIEVYAPIRREVIVTRRGWKEGRPPAITIRERERFVQLRQIQIQRGAIHDPNANRWMSGQRVRTSGNGTSTISRYRGGPGRTTSIQPGNSSSSPTGARTGSGTNHIRTGGGARETGTSVSNPGLTTGVGSSRYRDRNRANNPTGSGVHTGGSISTTSLGNPGNLGNGRSTDSRNHDLGSSTNRGNGGSIADPGGERIRTGNRGSTGGTSAADSGGTRYGNGNRGSGGTGSTTGSRFGSGGSISPSGSIGGTSAADSGGSRYGNGNRGSGGTGSTTGSRFGSGGPNGGNGSSTSGRSSDSGGRSTSTGTSNRGGGSSSRSNPPAEKKKKGGG